MYSVLKKYSPVLFVILFLLTLIPFLYNNVNLKPANPEKGEMYSPVFASLNSIKKMGAFVDSIYASSPKPIFDTSAYVDLASEAIKQKFYFGLSNYTFSDNWIAYLAGKLFWSHLSAIVDPDDILKHQEGLCSQQTIVFMDLLRQKKITTRSVGLGYKEGPGHFLCEVYYKGSWHLYDVTKEPEWVKLVDTHKSMEYYLANKDSLFRVYENRMPKVIYNKITEKVKYGNANEYPAYKMLAFHHFTRLLIYFLPLLFLIMFIKSFLKSESSNKINFFKKKKKQKVN